MVSRHYFILRHATQGTSLTFKGNKKVVFADDLADLSRLATSTTDHQPATLDDIVAATLDMESLQWHQVSAVHSLDKMNLHKLA